MNSAPKPQTAVFPKPPTPKEIVDPTSFIQNRLPNANVAKESLFRKFAANARDNASQPMAVRRAQASPDNVDQTRIDDAVATIKDRLREGFLGDVSHRDLKDIHNTFKGLNKAEANAVMDRLSNDDLKKLVSELDGTLGSFSRDEKKSLFDDLTSRLNTDNLNRLASAMDLGSINPKLRADDRNEPNLVLLGKSIAQHSPIETKIDFAKTMAAKAADSQSAGVAAAAVLSGMRDNPRELTQTINLLAESGQLEKVLDAASRRISVNTRNGNVVNYDPEPLVGLLNTVSGLSGEGSAKAKAQVFEIAARRLGAMESETVGPLGINYNKPAATAVRNALTSLIESDTQNVVRQLRLTDKSQKAEGLVTYTRSMIDAGESAKVSNLVSRLVAGRSNTTPKEHLEESVQSRDGKTYVYNNAEDLGYMVGSVEAATSRIAANDTKQAELFAKILGSAVSDYTGLRTIPGSGVIGATTEEVSKAFLTEMIKMRSRDEIAAGNGIVESGNPREVGELTEGALDAYEKMLDRVADRQDRASRR